MEMTREEAKHIIDSSEYFWLRSNGKEREALCMASNALEQDPVIDKIRAEIDNALSDGMIHKKTVLGIIDKYKGESEGEEPEI